MIMITRMSDIWGLSSLLIELEQILNYDPLVD